MSEYIEIEPEVDEDDPQQIIFFTNLPLLVGEGEVELYGSPAAMATGSPLAQALAVVAGLVTLRLEGQELRVTRQEEADEYALIADVTAVLKDFFL